MAGPTVTVRVLGDTKGLDKSFKDTAKQAQSASSQIHGVFSSTLGILNRAGVLSGFGEAIATVDDALINMGEHGKAAGQKIMAVGGALVGAGLGLAALGSKDRAARAQLQAAIEATGASFDDYSDRIEQSIKHNERFGDTAAATQDALRILTQATGNTDKAFGLMSTATDLAAAKHESLSEAAAQLGRVYNGSTRLLKEFGITVTKTGGLTKTIASDTTKAATADKALTAAKRRLADIEAIDAGTKHLTVAEAIRLRDAQQKVVDATQTAAAAHQKLAQDQAAAAAATKGHVSAVDALGAKLRGQASASADTFTGHLKAIGAEIEDQAAKFGQKYGPAITAAGTAVTGLGAAISVAEAAGKLFKTTTETTTAVQETATAATTAETEQLQLFATAEYEADTAGIGMIATVGLIVLAIAALGVAAYVIYRNWSTIWAAMKDAARAVWDWIRVNWPYILPFILGPIGAAALLVIKQWDNIKQGASDMWQWIKDGWNDLVGFFTALPGRITSIVSHLFDGFANAFVDAINFIIRIWNGLQFKVPGVSVFGHHFGGFTIGVPDIPEVPHLATGGLITSSGLVYAHAGEAITPLPSRLGPAVQIDNAHFSSEVDVDLFLRRAAWIVQTQRI